MNTKIVRSHPISRLIRPFFLRVRLSKASFGGALSGVSLMMAIGFYPVAGSVPASAADFGNPLVITTFKSGMFRTLPDATGISQGFHALHPGLDITAPEGSMIRPVSDGKVIEITTLVTGYGRSVVVDHGNGLISRYAHMGKIFVDEGDEVNEFTELGEVGLTGHTTGYHLHLEVRKNGNPLNPLPYLRQTT